MQPDPQDVEAIALLGEPVRRALYEWVVEAGCPVGRDAAAEATGVSRTLAAFHLDRLVAAGLLTPEYRRLSGRSGPGAGRPAKLYRRGPRQVEVALPDRRYALAADVLATALERDAARAPQTALRDAARERGRAIGEASRARRAPRGRRRSKADLLSVLRAQGYEPCEPDAGVVRLGNCPFHALVTGHRDLVCGMNLALAEGIIEGLRDHHHVARLDPEPGGCCVVFEVPPSAR